MKTVDVGAVLDEGRWTGYQKLLIAGTALTIVLDGVDNQLLPNAVPFGADHHVRAGRACLSDRNSQHRRGHRGAVAAPASH